jgi:ankyrin repeat protein
MMVDLNASCDVGPAGSNRHPSVLDFEPQPFTPPTGNCIAINMASKTLKPGLILSLPAYLKQRNKEYKALHASWRNGTTDCQYAPPTWPADRCMLVRLPAELLLLVCDPLYQADLFHLALTCRALAGIALHLLYERDITRFDCLALRWACTLGIVPTLERTLSYGAPPDHVFHPDSHAKCAWVIGGCGSSAPFDPRLCDTPLATAIVANEPEIVRLLLAHGVDPNAPDPKASDPTYSRLNECMFPIHLAMGAPHLRDMYSAFAPGNPGVVRHLLDAGANPNTYTFSNRPCYFNPSVRGFTPLLMAMQAEVPVETVRLLLERGAHPLLPGSYQATFFHRLRCRGDFWDRSPLGAMLLCSGVSGVYPVDLEKVQLLLAYGGIYEICYLSSSSARPDIPMPVLFRHWNHRQVADILRLFITEGADIASWGTTDIPATLSLIWWTEQFISRCYRNAEYGKIPEAIAKACEVITLMAEATLVGDGPGPVQKSAIIDGIVSPDVDGLGGVCRGRKGQTALRYVCSPFRVDGLAPLVPVLLRYGADPNSPDPHGRTALHHAAMFSSGGQARELVSFLGGPAASGLEIDAVDSRGWTPLHYACLFGHWNELDNQVATARLLLEHGANCRARTNNGWTPLSLAAFAANRDLVELLLDHGAHFKDLFLRRGSDPEPTMAPIGRILFCRLGDVGSTRETATALAISKTCTAMLLSQRTGIPVYVPPVLEFPMLPRYSRLERDLDSMLNHFGMDFVDHPFGVSAVELEDLTGWKFEDEIEGVLDTLDRLGLDAWVAHVRHLMRPVILWRACRRR